MNKSKEELEKAKEWVKVAATFLPSHMLQHYDTIIESLDYAIQSKK